MIKQPEMQRFWNFLPNNLDPKDCWIWQGTINNKGYPMFTDASGRSHSAQNFIYQLLIGPIEHGMVLHHAGYDEDHPCTSKACVNPYHKKQVTSQQNIWMGDGVAGVNHRKTHCKRGHPLSGENLIHGSKGERLCRTCTTEWKKRYARLHKKEKQNAEAVA